MNIEPWLLQKLKEENIAVSKYYCDKGIWQRNRYIQFPVALSEYIHYRYSNNQIELCFDDAGNFFSDISKTLYEKTKNDTRLEWLEGNRCRLKKEAEIANVEQLSEALAEIRSIFDPLLFEMAGSKTLLTMHGKLPANGNGDGLVQTDDEVTVETKTLAELFEWNLSIPDYQRNYCWEDEHIETLWSSLSEIENNYAYHLGTIILHRENTGNGSATKYNIIDGQQRLVTLTLILQSLRYEGQMPLLGQKFNSQDSYKHIANAKYVIEQLQDRLALKSKTIADNLKFSVLVLTGDNLDLAFTFFSNQNSRGVPLTDYDLLKTHHLRFISEEAQAKHLAIKWNSLSSAGENEGEKKYLPQTLGTHLVRLRKWMRKRVVNPYEKWYVKKEFSASPVMPAIPPFGERFYFNEKIQGGTHFFAYTDHFVYQFKTFTYTKQYDILHKHLSWEHWSYGNVIETLLLGYYLKFGYQYLSEALFVITAVMAQHRYSVARALNCKIREFASNSELVMICDQSSSPTFFLAESLSLIKKKYKETVGITARFYNCMKSMFDELKDLMTDETIKKMIEDGKF